jgi:hypothetical protein
MNIVTLLYPYQVQVELKKGQTLMVDANLQRPPCALHKNVCNRSGLPADTFELYYGSKRLHRRGAAAGERVAAGHTGPEPVQAARRCK